MKTPEHDERVEEGCLLCGNPVRLGGRALCDECIEAAERRGRRHRQRPIGGARTPFGTRVATAIVCAQCGKKDHIGFRPKPGARALCRACAAAVLDVHEVGEVKRPTLVRVVCSRCGREDQIPARRASEEEPLCHDCARGIYSRQGDRSKSAERRKSGTLLSRRRRSPGPKEP